MQISAQSEQSVARAPVEQRRAGDVGSARRCLHAPRAAAAVALAVAIVVAAAAGGCADSTPASASVPGAVAPAFASAEALVARFDTLAGPAFGPDSDLPAILALIRPENERQERLLACAVASRTSINFDRAVRARFPGSPSTRLRRPPFDIAPAEPARLVHLEASRSVAEFWNHDGQRKRLHLVQIGAGWHISGYTLENDSEVMLYADVLATYEQIVRWEAPLLATLTAGIQANRYASFEEVNAAYREAHAARLVAQPPPYTEEEARRVAAIDLSRKR